MDDIPLPFPSNSRLEVVGMYGREQAENQVEISINPSAISKGLMIPNTSPACPPTRRKSGLPAMIVSDRVRKTYRGIPLLSRT